MNLDFKVVSTGVQGLDSMLGGGLPESYIILVSGGPGTGKTIFSLQFLYDGALKGESSLYVSLDESPSLIRRNMGRSFNWDLESLERDNRLAIVDATPIKYIPGEVKIGSLAVGKREFTLMSLIDMIKKTTEKMNIKRIAVDPITSLIFQYPDTNERRFAVMDLIQCLTETGCTSLLTSELRVSSLEREYQPEEYLCQGVILLQTLISGGTLTRAAQIEKMRGVSHDNQPRLYRVTENGIVVYPGERVL